MGKNDEKFNLKVRPLREQYEMVKSVEDYKNVVEIIIPPKNNNDRLITRDDVARQPRFEDFKFIHTEEFKK